MLTRRQLIVAAAIASPAIQVFAGRVGAADPTLLRSIEAGIREVRFFSSDFQTVYQLFFPGAFNLEASSGTRPRSLTVDVGSDPRVIRSTEAVEISTPDSSVGGTEVSAAQEAFSVADEYKVFVSKLGNWEEAAVVLPFVILPLYPNDGVDDATDLSFTLGGASSDGTPAMWSPEVLAQGGLGWGASLSAAWSVVPTELDDPYAYPSRVSCRSVGPADLPAGAVITITVDKLAVQSMSVNRTGQPVDMVFSDSYEESVSELNGCAVVAVKLLNPVRAGEAVDIALDVVFADSPSDTKSLASVKFHAPVANDPWQRQTGREVARHPKVLTIDATRATRGNQ